MDGIILRGVKTHNLKNFDLVLPHRKLYVLTGVSGSGKSSLAFDTLYAEGQRRYVESLSAYARQFLERMEKPDVQSVSGIPPAIAIEAKNTIQNARSTVGTQTEINDYLRVLFARIGRIRCPACREEVRANHPSLVARFLIANHPDEEALILFRVELGKKGKLYLPESVAELERQGFLEFFVRGKVFSGEKLLKLAWKTSDELCVVADRLTVTPHAKKRLIDSLEMAWRFGRGEIRVMAGGKGFNFSQDLKCPSCARSFREPTPNLFSFNSPLGACVSCQGFGRVITIDWNLVVPDVRKTLREGAVEPWTKPGAAWEFEQLLSFCRSRRIPLDSPWKDLSEAQRHLILFGEGKEEYFSVKDFFEYLEKKTYKMHVRIFLSKYRGFILCPDCKGSRLKPDGLSVFIAGKNIAEIQELSIRELVEFVEKLPLSTDEEERVKPVYLEIQKRVKFMNDVGLGYLSLSRLSRTLSGGEVERIHLATSLGSALVDTLYVLDEPSIGLHERDNLMLIRLLKALRDLGNTVVVVEHDRAMIESADEVIDLGPLGGERGGEILYQGPVSGIYRASRSLTGQYLSGEREVKRALHSPCPTPHKVCIEILGAKEHNLKEINVRIPLGQMTVITGVSGSGKSTLLYDILYAHYRRSRGLAVQDVGSARKVCGLEHVNDMVLVDQSPIGRTPRSNPVTYIQAFDDIRKIYAKTHDARREGFEAGHFSFNVEGGRCPQCKGDGRLKVEMHFLADVFIPCEACAGKRFKPEVLEVRHDGKNIDEVLSLTVDEAVRFFGKEPKLVAKLGLLQKVGLGYLRLGQSAPTLSGGESQRLKLAAEMVDPKSGHAVYLFDEPTTGLHYHDIHYLMGAFSELLGKGHSLVIIEHNMEIIRAADFIIDLGPEGGDEGGRVIYSGPLAGLLKSPNSYTGKYLQAYLSKIREGVPAV